MFTCWPTTAHRRQTIRVWILLSGALVLSTNFAGTHAADALRKRHWRLSAKLMHLPQISSDANISTLQYLNTDSSSNADEQHQDSCEDVVARFDKHTSPANSCAAVLATEDCQETDAYVNYVDFLYCTLPGVERLWTVLGGIMLVGYMLILFIIIGVAADDFFCPSLEVLSDLLHMSQNIAGVTFLAFGNGAPDVFSSMAGVSVALTAEPTLSMGALLGGGFFVSTVVAGSVYIFSDQFDISQRPFLRDLVFYIGSVVWMLFILWRGSIAQLEAIMFLVAYVLYALVVVAGRVVYIKWLRDSGRQRALSMATDPSHQPHHVVEDIEEKGEDERRAVKAQMRPRVRAGSYRRASGEAARSFDDTDDATDEQRRISVASALPRLNADANDELRAIQHNAQGAVMDNTNPWPALSRLVLAARRISLPNNLPPHSDGMPSFKPRRTAKVTPVNTNPTARLATPPPGIVATGADAINNPISSNSLAVPGSASGHASSSRWSSAHHTTAVPVDDAQYDDIVRIEVPSRPASATSSSSNGSLRRRQSVVRTGSIRRPTLNTLKEVATPTADASFDIAILPAKADNNERFPLPPWWLDILEHIWPMTGDYWRSLKWYGRIWALIRLPVQIVLFITIPLVDPGEPTSRNWCKWLQTFQLAVSPALCLMAGVGVNDRTFFGILPLWAPVGILSLILAVVLAFVTRRDKVPRYHSLFALSGFLVAVVWIYKAANEIVGVLNAIGIMFHISPALLGLSLLAWGNSVPDFVADVALARQGFANVGISACYAGPLFNILVGMGLSFTLATAQAPGRILKFHAGPVAMLLCFSLLGIQTLTLLAVPLQRFRVHKAFGFILLAIYVVILTILILVELDVLPLRFPNADVV